MYMLLSVYTTWTDSKNMLQYHTPNKHPHVQAYTKINLQTCTYIEVTQKSFEDSRTGIQAVI